MLTFEKAFNATISKVYVDHNYPNRLYFEVVKLDDGSLISSITRVMEEAEKKEKTETNNENKKKEEKKKTT